MSICHTCARDDDEKLLCKMRSEIKCETAYLSEHSWNVKQTRIKAFRSHLHKLSWTLFALFLSSANIEIIIIMKLWNAVSPVRLSLSDENCVLNLVPMTISIHTINLRQLDTYGYTSHTRRAKPFETASKNTPQYCVGQHLCVMWTYAQFYSRTAEERLHLVKYSMCGVRSFPHFILAA